MFISNSVAYVFFCLFAYKLQTGTRAATLYLFSFCLFFGFSRPFSVRVLVSLSLAVKFISTILVYFPRLMTIYCQHEGRAFICGSVISVQNLLFSLVQ